MVRGIHTVAAVGKNRIWPRTRARKTAAQRQRNKIAAGPELKGATRRIADIAVRAGRDIARKIGQTAFGQRRVAQVVHRSEEHTSELQSLMRSSYAVFCLKKQNTNKYT